MKLKSFRLSSRTASMALQKKYAPTISKDLLMISYVSIIKMEKE